MVVADGSADYVITAVGTSPDLSDRLRLRPVIYFTDEAAMIEALAGGGVDAVAGGEVGNLDAARTQGGAFAVTAHDSRVGSRRVRAGDGGRGAGGVSRSPCRLADRGRAHWLPGVAGRARDLHAARRAMARRGVRLNGYEWRRRLGRTHEEVWDRLRGGENRKCARMVRRAEKWPSLPASTTSGSDRRSATAQIVRRRLARAARRRRRKLSQRSLAEGSAAAAQRPIRAG